jgi:protein-tyrosine kinase
MDTIEKALQKKNKSKLLDNTVCDNITFDNLADAKAKIKKDNEKQIETKQQIDNESIISIQERDVEEQSPVELKKSKLVEIDLEQLERMGFLSPKASNTLLNQEYRQIKRPLLNNIRGKSAHPIEHANIIQVTSSIQGEGKTFTSINLAIALAMEMDFSVLLVDADVIKASVTRILLNQNEQGLTDYLSGNVTDLSKVLLSTNIEKLKILPAGTQNQLSSELLNSKHMDDLLFEFSKRYENRIVIIDSPPILQTNESRILAHKVGQIVFVVEQNKTERNTVKSAIELIRDDAVVGLVMNKSRTSKSGSYYGYYGSNA